MVDLVSIIMPTYNCGRYIKESICSVLSQTYQNWELIIVDDCSSDGTIDVVQEMSTFDKRIHLIQNDINCGAAVSRNNALRKTKGRWIAFLDSDDLWMPDKLEKQILFMINNGCSFSYTGYQEIDEASRPTGVLVSGPRRITRLGMTCFCWPGCLTVMYDVEKIGLIQIVDIKKNNDYALWLKACEKADCYLLDQCLARYRRGRTGSISTHRVGTMIGWHYRLWHDAEGKNMAFSILHTGVNLVFGLYKKFRYVKRVK